MSALSDYVEARTVADGNCLRWIGALANGHPAMRWQGRNSLTRRVLYEAAHGPLPKGKVLRCICGTKLCVSVEHSRLTTHKAIAQQCGAQGLMSGLVRSARIAEAKRQTAKISQQAARDIRASAEMGTVLAARYGVTAATVSKIRLGKMRREFAGNVWAGLA